jgi:hypothetical protein
MAAILAHGLPADTPLMRALDASTTHSFLTIHAPHPKPPGFRAGRRSSPRPLRPLWARRRFTGCFFNAPPLRPIPGDSASATCSAAVAATTGGLDRPLVAEEQALIEKGKPSQR